MRISLLDRSRTREGESDAEAIATTVERAVRADGLGFRRFWTAEHHAVPGVAGAAPAVVLAAIGAQTSRIRLGTGGIMVPNHSPLVITEQALMLQALYPGRFDLGLGGSLGFTTPVRAALRRTSVRDGEYAAEVREVLRYLDGDAGITPRPRVPAPPVFLLAIRGGVALAAELGLPVVAGGPVLRDPAALAGYTENFRPNATGAGPYLMLSVDVSVADSPQRAREVLLSEAWAFAHSREVGEFRPLQPVEHARASLESSSEKTQAAVQSFVDAAIAGTGDQVGTELADLLAATGAEEIVASVSAFDRADVAATDEALADLISDE